MTEKVREQMRKKSEWSARVSGINMCGERHTQLAPDVRIAERREAFVENATRVGDMQRGTDAKDIGCEP